MDVILITRQLETATMLLCLSSRITTKQTEWLRKLPNKDFQITKTSRVCIRHFEPHFIKRHDVFPCANGDPDIIVSIENTLLNIRDYR